MPDKTFPDETFYWCGDEGSVEDVARYKLGGYHPVKLGDCFSSLPAKSTDPSSTTPRYRILHKLGHGSFATVWLARDMSPPGRFVALKITVADLPDNNCEARILKLIAENRVADVDGSQHILGLLDNFQIEGPNGTHEVLVTEVLASLSKLKYFPVYKKFQKLFIRQAFLGISYLHSQGIAHGDLHIGNFGCSLPGLNERTELDFMTHFDNPECIPILAVNPMDQTASLPPYLVVALSTADYLAQARQPLPIEVDPPLLKILDFGGAFRQYEPRPPMRCAIAVCPPEVVFPTIALGDNDPDWDIRSDIWSLACTVYEIVVGGRFFHMGGSRLLLHWMSQMVGELPPAWALYWASNESLKNKDISAARAAATWMNHKPAILRGCTTEEEADRLIDLLQSMFVLDPSKRPSVRQVMETHPWLEQEDL